MTNLPARVANRREPVGRCTERRAQRPHGHLSCRAASRWSHSADAVGATTPRDADLIDVNPNIWTVDPKQQRQRERDGAARVRRGAATNASVWMKHCRSTRAMAPYTWHEEATNCGSMGGLRSAGRGPAHRRPRKDQGHQDRPHGDGWKARVHGLIAAGRFRPSLFPKRNKHIGKKS